MDWLMHRMGTSKEVQEAMASSAQGEARARAFRQEIKEIVDPLRPTIDHNHFEDAVRRTFQRRSV